ncbi:MAG: prepilin-type N-terminal cleavage/methylation domain-containing protein [Phycisphaerales bacterium]|nr:prepilin-type N-terminal cleavage/methylation domain-containing protein [Phycisphaerales bacterium]
MSLRRRTIRRGFTLVELLVVISIIALLISLLLPSLKRARDQAKALKCGAQLRGLGFALQTYGVENDEWIPGRNTTGLETWIAGSPRGGASERLARPTIPVQTYDWMTPILRVTTTLPANRAVRFRDLLETYRCPSVNFKAILYSSSSPPDNDLFVKEIDTHGAYYGISYLMPVHFQLWGYEETRAVVGYHPIAPTLISMPTKFNVPNYLEVKVSKYRSRIDAVGTPAEKIAAADGTRYLDEHNELDFDHHQDPDSNSGSTAMTFGSFTSAGAWWRGSTAYGVFPYNIGRGKNIPMSYRHYDGIEALFFDSHVERLTQRQSRKIDYWYPRGGVVAKAAEGMKDYDTYANGYVIR